MTERGHCRQHALVTKLADALQVDLRAANAPRQVNKVGTTRLTRDLLGEGFHLLSQRRVSQYVLAEPMLARILSRPRFAGGRFWPRAAARIGAVGL
jgi:hypothetical protein